MAHVFLQEDPKVSFADNNDAPSSIPTPEQLGSFLVTTDGATGNGRLYAAVPTPTPAWVSVGLGTGVVGIVGGGTPDRVAKFILPDSIGDSQITDVTGGAVTIQAATSATMFATGGNAQVTSIGGTAQILAAGGSAQLVATGVGGIVLLSADDDVNITAGQDVNITATAGDVVASAPATSSVSIQNPNANVTVGTGGSNNNIDVTASGNLTVNVVGSIGLNGALFLGAYSVATLPVGITQAMAFATDLCNLDGAIAYPGLQGAGAGTGGIVVRFTDGVWRISGTNIVATS